MACSCSFIPCVAGFAPAKLGIGTDVPVVPGKAILTVGVNGKRCGGDEM